MLDKALWSRRLVKSALASTLGPFLRQDEALVVTYHRVVDRFETEAQRALRGNLVSRAMLERHLECIGRHYTFGTLDQLAERVAASGNGHGRRRPLAVVTFDDGYRDVYENAFPLLIRKGIPAAVFVVTDVVGTSKLLTHDKLYLLVTKALSHWSPVRETLMNQLELAGVSEAQRQLASHADGNASNVTRALLTVLSQADLHRIVALLEREFGLDDPPAGYRPMDWEMLAKMRHAGITIGSHTKTHVLLTNESRCTLVKELTESRCELERRLGVPVKHFAYPDGRFNRGAVDSVAAAGYRFGYTTCLHRDPARPLLTIPRRVLWEQSSVGASGEFSPLILRCQAYGILTGQRGCTWRSHE